MPATKSGQEGEATQASPVGYGYLLETHSEDK